MADRFDQLKSKYRSVLNFIQQQNIPLLNVNMQDDKLFIRATAPSQDAKNRVWDEIKLVDPNYSSDLIADIETPMAKAASVGHESAASAGGKRTYTVAPGDSLSKISQHFYGDGNQYMKIFEANRDKLSDPNKIRPGTTLVIP